MSKSIRIVGLVVLVVVVYYLHNRAKRAIISDMKFAEGHCVGLDYHSGRTGPTRCTLVALFKVAGKEYKARSYSDVRYMKENLDRLGKIKLNIVYYRWDPNDSYILIRKKDFEEFGLNVPDSIASIYYEVTGSTLE